MVTRLISENLVPWNVDVEGLYSHPSLTIVREDVINDYMRDMKAWNYHPGTNSDDSVKVFTSLYRLNLCKITYTAMHGVGKKLAERIFQEFSLSPFIPVLEQVDPDPDFPTVAFPNPEEGKGALVSTHYSSDSRPSEISHRNR
jgi:phosphomannomutase